ncbi:MAG: hypothetical protein HFI19_14755 [Lachnospiraceae bacterium]|jgi:Predicted metal-dependent hydrolase with the TIM-barrel fold|uniref:phosphotriesterase family protein n=1 Tax=Candidatus Merdisoma sp. JLR.KK006 TaxID=3112626 RepID=UPI002FF2E9C3|nr:hypothetical protein [Lachnospiraceae bacterium]
MSVKTVLGNIEASQVGICAPHEHIYIDMKVFFVPPEEIGIKNLAYKPVTMESLGILRRNPFAVLDNVSLMDEETQIEEILAFKSAGGNTIVDASNIGLGRDPELLARAAARTGLNIIAGSGYYVEGAQRPEVLELTAEQIEEEIVGDLEKEIGHTGIRAGYIGEIGVSHEMFPFEKKSLIGACRAQVRTGAPLMIHINPWSTQGIAAMEIVKEHKIDPEKVIICHSDVENREDYIFRLLDMGVYIEFDNWGKEMFTDRWDVKPGSGRFVSDWERVLLVKKIVDRGYANQMLLSTDLCLKSLLHKYGGWGYDHVLKHILPMLDEVGVSREQIETMLKVNPARWLDW